MANRILILTPEYTLGGAETQLRYIIYALEAQGYLTDVYILNSLKKNRDSLLEKDMRCMQSVSFFELSLYRRSEYGEREGIREYVCDHIERGYDVALIFHERFAPLIPFFKEMGIATVYSERLEGKRICLDESCRPFVKECDILTANSAYAAKRMEITLKRNVRFVPNGKERQERLSYIRKEQIKNILVPCRIDPVKNLRVVLDMAALHTEREFEIHFVGEREYENYAKMLESRVNFLGLESRVSFTGYKESMREEYGWADLIVLPSLAEGTPNVVLEAYQYGRPVIVSDIEPEREIVTDERLRFPPGDAEGLFSCIRYLEKMPGEIFEDMLEAHSCYVLDKYDLSKMTESFIEILNEAGELKTKQETAAGYEACRSELKNVIRELEKKEQFYKLLCKWNKRLQDKDAITHFFTKRGYYKVAIYGFRELGELLYWELQDSEVEVCCIIDRCADRIDMADVPVIYPDSNPDETVDMIVVTATSQFEAIRDMLGRIWNCVIVSLTDIVFEE